MANFDILIKNGTVLDGISSEAYSADVGISGSEIRAIGKLPESGVGKVIDASGQYVSPGFIDVQNHSDSYLTILEIPSQESLVSQGITTSLVGHCGTSLAPLSHPQALKSVQKWHSLAGANLNWLSFKEYLLALEAYPLGLNVGSLIGHSTLRRGLLKDEIRPATAEEIKMMGKMIENSLEVGAGGVSLGLMYAHEVDASKQELLSAAKLVGEQNKLLSVHLRSEGAQVNEALDEVIGLGLEAGVRTKISHFKIRKKKNWQFLQDALSRIDRAYQQGLDIFFDVYPYSTSWTVLYTYLPRWAYEGGRGAVLKNLQDRSAREKIIGYLKNTEHDLSSILIATSETNLAFIGKTLGQIATNQEISVEEALLNVLTATQTQVVVFDHNLSEEVMEMLLKHPLSVVASDGAGYDFQFSPAHGLVHPRCFGTFPKFLSMVREKKLMTWESAIKKICSLPAAKIGLEKRGTLKKGKRADIVVFNPLTVGSRASYENPYVEADGINYVFVNGQLSHPSLGEESTRSGNVLRL